MMLVATKVTMHVLFFLTVVIPVRSQLQSIQSLSLINTVTKATLGLIVNGTIIFLDDVGDKLTVQANIVNTSSITKSVVFDMDGKSRVRVENTAPYTLSGDSRGIRYFASDALVQPGVHTISATTYSRTQGRGKTGKKLTIQFTTVAAVVAPIRLPTKQPVRAPAKVPIRTPTKTSIIKQPNVPVRSTTRKPSSKPSKVPFRLPTRKPASKPTKVPLLSPTNKITIKSTKVPRRSPTIKTTIRPAKVPIRIPTRKPSKKPTKLPIRTPTKTTTIKQANIPVHSSTRPPSRIPTKSPFRLPTSKPTSKPTKIPYRPPTRKPTNKPMNVPIRTPTKETVIRPTNVPVRSFASNPTSNPTKVPLRSPSRKSTRKPTKVPSRLPTMKPTSKVIKVPFRSPTRKPTIKPTLAPLRRPEIAAPLSPPYGFRVPVPAMPTSLNSNKCGGAVNSGGQSLEICTKDLWNPTGDKTQHCYAYGGPSDPCSLHNNNDVNDGLFKNPAACSGGTFYLWDEPDTQGKSYTWAGVEWTKYASRFANEIQTLRARGVQFTSPLLRAGDEGVIADNLNEFYAACGSVCHDPKNPAYINVNAINAFVGPWNAPGIEGCRDAAKFITNEVRSYNNKFTASGRPWYVTNWSRLGTFDIQEQVNAMLVLQIFFETTSPIQRIYWFGATDYGGNSGNNYLTSKLVTTDGASTTLGKIWDANCIAL